MMLMAAPFTLLAQPVVNNAELYTAGTQHRYVICNPATHNPGANGADQVWDFSQMVPTGDTVFLGILAASAVPGNTAFPAATLAQVTSDSVKVFFTSETNGNFIHGILTPSLSIHYTNSMKYTHRPLVSNTLETDAFTNNFTTSNYYFSGGGATTITTRGYGTLALPTGTFTNVLKTKLVHLQSDTLLQFGSVSTYYYEKYAWFDPVSAAPLLEMDSTASDFYNSRTLRYLPLQNITTGLPNNQMMEFQLFPNPASESFTVFCLNSGTLHLKHLTGAEQLTMTTERGPNVIKTDHLSEGFYLLTFTPINGATVIKKLLVKH